MAKFDIRKNKILLWCLILLLSCTAVLVPTILITRNNKPNSNNSNSSFDPNFSDVTGANVGNDVFEAIVPEVREFERTYSKVGQYAEDISYVPRQHPEVTNEGLSRYPVYGAVFSNTDTTEKQAICDENNYLRASSTTYDSMDADGNLYLAGTKLDRKLYKHTASEGMYYGNVSDSERAVVRKLTINSRPSGNHITGLYAPAGEVIKIEISQEDLDKTGGILVEIGQALFNKQSNSAGPGHTLKRMPNILNSMTVTTTEAYVGSFLGGPIYLRPVSRIAPFSVTITGGVKYRTFIYGYTTREEFEQTKNSSVPYCDVEVWDNSVRHSGPLSSVAKYSYDDLAQACILWDKISRVSKKVPSGSLTNIGINFIYDPFIPTGGLISFVGRSTVACPPGYFTTALDAYSATTNASDGFWGCIHEYNHHFQVFGFAPGDEVTNNSISLVSYSLFTRNSANRTIGNASEGNYAVSWNRYTNPSWVLKQTLNNTRTNSGLDTYANLLYGFGQQTYLRATQLGRIQSYSPDNKVDKWYGATSDATGYDMAYYFQQILHQTISENVLATYKAKNYPMYVPVASIYQIGQGYYVGDEVKYSQTTRPYRIPVGEPYVMDFNHQLVVPHGFTCTIKKVTAPKYGQLVKTDKHVYTYTPSNDSATSGQFEVVIGITKDDGAFSVKDVHLVMELEQSNARISNVLDRTVYTYSAENMYTSVQDAVDNNYAGYLTKTEEYNTNPTQNCNTDIWVPNPAENAIMEVRGKVAITKTGKYRIALRGRRYAAMYISLDGGNTYQLAGNINNLGTSANFYTSNSDTYSDYDLTDGQYVYFKEVLLVTYGSAFIGMGMGMFNGDQVNISYLNAYNVTYERELFESQALYTRDYTYTYTNNPTITQTLVDAKYKPWDSTSKHAINTLFDDDPNNFIHSNKENISEENPFELTADLGQIVDANKFTILGAPSRLYLPTNYKLYGGTTLDNMSLLIEVTGATRTGNNIIAWFGPRSIRYYKLVVTDTMASGIKYIAFRGTTFGLEIGNGIHLSTQEKMFEYDTSWTDVNAMCTFGSVKQSTDGTMKFAFEGKRFAIFSLTGNAYGKINITIDDVNYGEYDLNTPDSAVRLTYLSQSLTSGKHTVTIRCIGKANIDSVVIWK